MQIKNLKFTGQMARGAALYESDADVRKFADAVTNAAAGDIVTMLKAVKFGANIELAVFDFMETATRHIARQEVIEKAAKTAKAAAVAAIEKSMKSASPTVTPRTRPGTRALPGLGALVEAAKSATPEHGEISSAALARKLGATPVRTRKLLPPMNASPAADAREKDKANREIRELEARLERENRARIAEEKKKTRQLRSILGL